MYSIQPRIFIKFREHAHQLSAYFGQLPVEVPFKVYLPSISSLIHEHLGSCFIRCLPPIPPPAHRGEVMSRISHYVKSTFKSSRWV